MSPFVVMPMDAIEDKLTPQDLTWRRQYGTSALIRLAAQNDLLLAVD